MKWALFIPLWFQGNKTASVTRSLTPPNIEVPLQKSKGIFPKGPGVHVEICSPNKELHSGKTTMKVKTSFPHQPCNHGLILDHLHSVHWRKKRRKEDTTPTTSGSQSLRSAATPTCPAQRRPLEAFQCTDIAYLFPGRRCGKSEASSKSTETQVSFERASSSGIYVSGKKSTFTWVLNQCFMFATWLWLLVRITDFHLLLCWSRNTSGLHLE